mmetsp:Transcript_17466/g.37753  ORF Transcript_17466/g.37753 Transcript_17466/m.37753 type:complete len:238 (+) Transcript_17466:1822-2535(+)
MLTVLMRSPFPTFCTRTPVAERPWHEISFTRCLTITPWEVMSIISSSSSTTRIVLILSSSRPALNLMAITPEPPRAVVRNSLVFTRLPYPSVVTTSKHSSSLPVKTFISAILSWVFIFMDFTPRLVLAVGRRLLAANRVACPREDPTRISSASVHFSHQFSRSPSTRDAIMRPREVNFSNAARGVFLIHPNSVARTMYSSLENLETGRTEVMTSLALTGKTDGMGAPLAVLPASGIW